MSSFADYSVTEDLLGAFRAYPAPRLERSRGTRDSTFDAEVLPYHFRSHGPPSLKLRRIETRDATFGFGPVADPVQVQPTVERTFVVSTI